MAIFNPADLANSFMPEEHKKVIEEEVDQPAPNPVISPGVRNILVILVVLIAIGVVGYLVIRTRSKNDQNPSTADQIHNSFNPPASSSPSFVPPAPGSQFSGGPNSSAPSSTVPTVPKPQNNPAVPKQTAPAAPAGPVVYQNPALGFALTIPNNWIVDDRLNPDHVVFFDRNTGQMVGYMEVYGGTPYNNLQDVAMILQGSPAVANITTVSVAGQPALLYTAAPGYSGGVATVFNGRIYYFHGVLANSSILSSFKFI